jgi:hypothetical protein
MVFILKPMIKNIIKCFRNKFYFAYFFLHFLKFKKTKKKLKNWMTIITSLTFEIQNFTFKVKVL